MSTCPSPAGINAARLDAYLRRLVDVQEELAELGPILESAAKDFASAKRADDPSKQLAEFTNKYHFLVFRAYHLATEGLALVNLLDLAAALLSQSTEGTVDPELSQKLALARQLVDELEPLLRTMRDQLEPYKSLGPK